MIKGDQPLARAGLNPTIYTKTLEKHHMTVQMASNL